MENETTLTVILHADVVGSTALVQRDEKVAHEAVQDIFRRFSVLIEAAGGIVHELRGDALVAEFSRASDAASIALDFQADNRTHLAVQGNEICPELRIGTALGEVVTADSTVTGAAVVLAQRLEQLAPPSGVCISAAIREAVPNRPSLEYRDLGEQQLKGFDFPQHAYVLGKRLPVPRPVGVPRQSLESHTGTEEQTENASIAILSFENMSGDPEQDYFSDGIAADIIIALSKLPHLFVIARNSSFSYKGKAMNLTQIATDLGVRHVLEGGVRKVGNRVRVTVQLVDGATGGTVWADRYDRELEDVFAVQDELTREIVAALNVNLTSGDHQRIRNKGTRNLEAYDCYLRGREEVWRFSKVSWDRGRHFLERAIELEPDFARAYSEISVGYSLEFVNRWVDSPDDSREQAYEYALKAQSLDDSDPSNHVAMSIIERWRRNLDRALEEVEHAIRLDPNNAFAYSVYANTLHYAGRAEEALEKIETAMRLDPFYPDLWLHFLAQIYFMMERYDDAVVALQRRLLRFPETDISRVLLTSSYGHLGRQDAAKAEWAEVLRINPGYSLEYRQNILPYKNPADFERIKRGLVHAGVLL